MAASVSVKDEVQDSISKKDQGLDNDLINAFRSGLKLDPDGNRGAGGGSQSQTLTDLKSTLQSINFFPNWALEVCGSLESFEKCARTALELITTKMDELFKINKESESQGQNLGPDLDLAEIKYSAFELVGRKLGQLYITIYFDQKDNKNPSPDKVEEAFGQTRAFVDLCFGDPNHFVAAKYRGGVEYLMNLLRAYHAAGRVGDEVEQKEALATIRLKSRDQLTDMEQVGVAAVKQYFIGSMLTDAIARRLQLEILDKMIVRDPQNPEWHWMFGLMLRYQRKDKVRDYSKQPTMAEIIAFSNAVRIDKTGNPQYSMARCNVMAEFLRDQFDRRCWDPEIDWGCKFKNAEMMAEFLHEEIRHILTLCPVSVWANVSAAEIYSKVLPYKYRDSKFAKICIERALIFHPSSSKACTRMAIMCLVEDKNLVEAEKYLKQAVKGDWRNFPGIMELAQLYLSPGIENHVFKLKDLLDRQLGNGDWSHNRQAQLLMVKGLGKFANGNPDLGVEAWVAAFKLENAEVFNFIGRMGTFTKRYQCPSTMTNPRELEEQIGKVLAMGGSAGAEEREILKDILKFLAKSGASRERGGFDRGRGGRGRGRGQYGRGRGRDDGPVNWRQHGNDNPVREGSGGDKENAEDDIIDAFADPYKILGVERDATPAEIKNTYRDLYLLTHPDKNPQFTDAEKVANLDKMRRINVAFELLNRRED